MSEALKQYARERLKELLKDVPPEQRLEGLSPEQRLKGLSLEQRLGGLSPEHALGGIIPEELDALEALIRQRKANGPSAKPQ